MNRFALLFLLAFAASAHAAEPRQEIRVIPKTYVSPGASGSVSGHSRTEVRQRIGGYEVPVVPLRQDELQIQHQQRGSGGLRQSTEYPGGLRIERQPGSSSEHYQRTR